MYIRQKLSNKAATSYFDTVYDDDRSALGAFRTNTYYFFSKNVFTLLRHNRNGFKFMSLTEIVACNSNTLNTTQSHKAAKL